MGRVSLAMRPTSPKGTLRMRFTVLSLLCCVFYQWLSVSYASGQQNSPPRSAVKFSLDKEVIVDDKPRSLIEFVKLIQTVAPAGFIANGLTVIEKVSLPFTGKLSTFLDKLFPLFDYSWRLDASGNIQLEKRFSGQDDLPQFVPDEIKYIAGNILKYLPNVPELLNMNISQGLLDRIALSLSGDQVKRLTASESIKLSALTPEQQDMIHQAVQERTYGKARGAWMYILYAASGMKSSVVTHRQIKGASMVNYAAHSFLLPNGDVVELKFQGSK